MPSQFGGIPVAQENAQKMIDVFDPYSSQATPPKSQFGGIPAKTSQFGGKPALIADTAPKSQFGGVPIAEKTRDLTPAWLKPAQSGISRIGAAAGGAVENIGKAVSEPLKAKGGVLSAEGNPIARVGEVGGRVADVTGNMVAAGLAVPTGAAAEIAKDTGAAKKLSSYVAGKVTKATPEQQEQIGNKLADSTADVIGSSLVQAGAVAAGGAKLPKEPIKPLIPLQESPVIEKSAAAVHPIETAYKETYPTIKARDYDPAQHGSAYVFKDGTTIHGNKIIHEEMAEPIYKKIGEEDPGYGNRSVHMLDNTGAMRISGFGDKSAPILFESGQGFTPKQIARAAEIIKNNPERKIEFWDRGRFAGETPSEVLTHNQKLEAGEIPKPGAPIPPKQSKIFSPDQASATTQKVSSIRGVADRLYQQRSTVRADYKEFTKWAKQFKDVPKSFWQKALDHLDDPKSVPLNPQEQLVFDRSVGVLRDEIDANRAEIKAAGFDPRYLETESEGLGGAIRQRKGAGTPMDRLTGTKTEARAPEGGRSVSRSAGTFKGRNMMALVKNGVRQIVHIDDEGNIFDASKKGDTIGKVDETGKSDTGGKLGEATRKEIEQATNGEIKYHDNAFGVYSTALLQTRRALRSVRLLNEIKQAPEFNEIARGPGAKSKDIPKGWREIPDAPEFRGYRFEPHYAEEIEDFLKGANRDMGKLNLLDKLNRFTLNLLFWANPIHAYNITDAFLTTKGLGGLAKDLPGTTSDLLKSIKSVATRDKYNMQQARAGVPLPGLDTAGEEFRRMTLDIMGIKARQDPKNFLQYIKRFGFDNPKDFFERMSEVSHKAVFSWQDVLQQTLERGYMRQGMSQAEATEKAAKTFMNYRTPSRVMDQRWMGQALQGQAWLDFPKYAYGRLKGVYNIANDARKGDPHAIDQALMIAALYEFGQHVINPLLKQYTGQDNAEAGNFGYTGLVDQGVKLAEGQRTPGQAFQGVLSPGYLSQSMFTAAGVNPFFAQPISIPGESLSEVAMDYASEAANKLSPMQRFGQIQRGTITPEDLWLEQLGVKFPNDPTQSKYNRRQLKAREKRGSQLEQELTP